jgi:chromosome segregation ATPase
MDAELLHFLEARFSQQEGVIRSEFGSLRSQVGQLSTKVSSLESDVGSLKGEVGFLKAETASLRVEVTSIKGDVAALRAEMSREVSAVRDEIRQTRIHAENIESKIGLIAEGYLGLEDKLDRSIVESTLAFDQVKSWIDPFYKSLEGRVRGLESREAREHEDVMESVKKLVERNRRPLEA